MNKDDNFFGFGEFFSKKSNSNVVLTKKSGKEQIRQYFTQVCKLNDGGNEFPVDFDSVWPLSYSTKGNALKVLLANEMFQENIDYKVFIQNDKNPKGGKPTEKYKLTVECMEYFIARKERTVFEVYRQVFHFARKQAALPVEDRVANMVIDNLAPVFETMNALLKRVNDVELLADKLEMTVKHGDPHATPPIKPLGRENGQYKTANDFIDARHRSYYTVERNGGQMRCIEIDDKPQFSMADVLVVKQCRTSRGQVAAQLNRIKPGTARKIWLYAQTHPAWFVNEEGLDLLLMNR